MAARESLMRRTCITVVGIVATLALAACGGDDGSDKAKPPAPTPGGAIGECGTLTIAYDPSSGYEASPFIVGAVAERELDCKVAYVKTTSRNAWRVVARGDADVYLDAYGNEDLREKFAGEGGPVAVVGPNGIKGGVDLLAPAFMGDLGLSTSQDLPDTSRIGWGVTTPAITTMPELVPLAKAFIDFQKLDYIVRNAAEVDGRHGMRYLLPEARVDDGRQEPNLYLVAAPRALLGAGPGSIVVDIPESAAEHCEPDPVTTLCSLDNFGYQKIVNSDFAASDSPAYSLVYAYQLGEEDASTIEELVALSGYNVGAADVESWINTHKEAWKVWLK
jgi:glycine betaine/proline transport system substrate-binding protein